MVADRVIEIQGQWLTLEVNFLTTAVYRCLFRTSLLRNEQCTRDGLKKQNR